MIQNAQVSVVCGIVKVTAPCIVTGKAYSVELPAVDYERWQNGGKIQNVAPYLNKDQREFLISGTSPEGFEKLFPKPIEHNDRGINRDEFHRF